MNRSVSKYWIAALLSLVVGATAGAAVFTDGFSTTGALSPDPLTNVNIEVPARQTGFITGNWNLQSQSAGAGGPRAMYLANGISGLDGNVLLNRVQYTNTTGSIILQSATSPDLGNVLIGQKYSVSGSLLLDDTQGTSSLTDVTLKTTEGQGYKVEFALNDSQDHDNTGVRLRLMTTNSVDWTWALMLDSAVLETGDASGLDFGQKIDVTLTIDEVGAQPKAKVSFSYNGNTINSGLYVISLNDVRRQVRLFQRYYIISAPASTDLILDVQFDDISVDIIPASGIFTDDFTADLGGTDPNPDQNIDIGVSSRQRGLLTGNWTESFAYSSADSHGVYLADSVSALTGNVLLNRAEYNGTGARIVRQTADSVQLADQVAGTSYVVSGKMLLDDTQGAIRVSDVTLNSVSGWWAQFGMTDSATGQTHGILLQLVSNDGTSWTWNFLDDAAVLETGSLAGFSIGDAVDVTLSIDETGAQDTASVAFTYGSTTITSATHNITLANQSFREVRTEQRYYVKSGPGTNLKLDVQFDDIAVDVVSEKKRGTTWVDIMRDEFYHPATPPLQVVSNAPSWAASSISTHVWEGNTNAVYWVGTMETGLRGFPGYKAVYFDIQNGYTATNVLRIEAEVKNNSGSWAGIGFSDTSTNSTGLSQNIGWMDVNGDGSGGNGKLWAGPGTTAANSVVLNTGRWIDGQVNTVAIEYDLNDDGDGNGTLRAYINGTLMGTVADTSAVGMPKYIFLVFYNGSPGTPYYDSVRVSVQSQIVPIGVPVSMEVSSADQLNFTWISKIDRSYDLESRTGLTASGWEVYGSYGDLVSPGFAAYSLTNVPINGPVRFFRVIEK